MSRRFQFSLATLLLATAIAAVAVNWWTLRQRVVAKAQRYDEALANFDLGLETWEGMLEASKELLQSELAVPLVPSDQVAWLSYLDRTRHLYRKARALGYISLFDDLGAERHRRICKELVAECRDVEDRLGLPHADYDDRPRDLYEDEMQPDDFATDESAPPAPDDDRAAESLISN